MTPLWPLPLPGARRQLAVVVPLVILARLESVPLTSGRHAVDVVLWAAHGGRRMWQRTAGEEHNGDGWKHGRATENPDVRPKAYGVVLEASLY
jgi:hypothetical protein